jgi:arginine/ornithine N-succinyltransferase beta subunit
MIEGCVAAFNADTCVKCEDGKFLFENGFVSECRDVGERIDCAQPYLDIQNDSVYCLGCGSGDYVIKKLDFSETSGNFFLINLTK